MKFIKKTSGLILFFLSYIFSNLFCLPMNNYYDSAIFYNVRGIDKYYIKKRPWFDLQLSPYTQLVSGSKGLDGGRKGPDGYKWGEGDRLGWWNMLGPFFGRNASPTDKPFELAQGVLAKNDPPSGDYERYLNYPNLVLGGIVLDGNSETYISDDVETKRIFTDQEIEDSKVGSVDLADPTTDSISKILYDFTDETNFDEDRKFARLSVPIDFEKVGLRSKLNFSFGKYFDLNVKTGFCYYSQRPTFIDKTNGDDFYDQLGFPNSNAKSKYLIETYLTDVKKIRDISQEVDFNVKRYSKTAMEDTHVEFTINYPMELEDKVGDLAVTFVPILSCGVWAPSGSTYDQDYAFSLATGNDGFLGLTVDGSLNIDFAGTIQLAFGAGAAFFEEKNLSNQRIPSSKYQYGIYPWKTDIKKQPGTTWYANFSMMAQNFTEDLSFYCDFIHTEHRKDSIELKEENDNFYPQKMIDESSWRTEIIFMGLDYAIVPACSMGISFQSVVGGARVYRTTTILGTITLNF